MAAKRQDWIPTRNDDIYNKLRAYLPFIVANKVAWGIPDSAIDPLLDLQSEFEPLYHKIQDKRTRTGADVRAHRRVRDLYKKEIRTFANEYLMFNSSVMDEDSRRMLLTVRDTEPTLKGKIAAIPYVLVKSVGGGTIEVRVRVEKDQTKSSMHPLADAVEVKYIFVPAGEMPPEDPETCPKHQNSKKARFTIPCGVKNAGQSFYGFFRWVNLTTSANSGDWTTKALGAVIA